METKTEDGYVINCTMVPSKDQEGPMFIGHPDGSVTAHLDGYAVIPMERYQKLIEPTTSTPPLSRLIKDNGIF